MPTLDPTLYTVAWIAPLEIEVQAALQILDRIHSGRFPISAGDKYVYHAGEICGHNVIIATFAAGQTYGTNSATSLASHVKHYFRNLRFGLLVGVAAGLPDLDYDPPRDIRLGDVLVALPDGDYPAILPYGLGKQIGANKFKLLRDGHSLPQTEPIVGSAIGKIKAIEQEARIILEYYKEVIQKAPKFSDPGQEKDLFNPSSKALPTPRERRPDDKRTRVWYGSIGSGDKLLKCSEGGDDLRKKYHVIGLEMEAAGVLSEIPVGNIRGVCDYGDERKNKDWQPYAAVMAAAYAKAVLSEIPPENEARLVASESDFSDEDRSCLLDLQFTNPDDDRRRIEETKGGFFEGSFRWIVDNAEYREWYSHQHSQILWIKGDAGKGKTMLMIGIIQKLRRQIEAGSSDRLAYFLCQGTDERLNNATAALRGLIYMLVVQQPRLMVHLRKRYDPEGRKPFETSNAFYAFSAVFESMIKDIKQGAVYLLVDALDECKLGLSDLLRLISKTATIQEAYVKWIVSSRNIHLVEQDLNLENSRSKLSLELNAHHISMAIEEFISHQVSRLNILKDDQSLREQVKDQLCRKSDGTFLWVALVVNELGKCQFEEEVLDAMDNMPTDLPKLYDQMVEQITQLQGRRRDVCLTILSMVVIAYRPLHLSEMCHVMNRRKVQDVENAVAMCGSFLTIRDKYIYLIHQSAKDHLDKVHATTSFLKDPSATHYEMYSQSLQVLSAKLHRNIYRLDNPGVTVSEITASRPNPDPLFDLQYSCIYWLNHFLDVDPECVDMLKSAQIISEFFKEHLLHWLESLGLIGEMRHAILALRKLVHQVAVNQPVSDLTGFKRRRVLDDLTSTTLATHKSVFKEAERFATSYGFIIQKAPLQAYCSGLIFCPRHCESRRLHWHERLDYVDRAEIMQEFWDPCMQTLEGHGGDVKTVAFSPDGLTVASGSDDRTVRLWDAATGTQRQTLQGHGGYVNAVAFSPDGLTVASASNDRTVRLWDAATGTHRQTLQGHEDCVNAVAFSPDGLTVASASNDRTVRLWDVATGTQRQTLQGHESWVKTVAFSPDGLTVASASSDWTVRLWDAATGTQRQALQGHEDCVTAVTFSPDGLTMAFASDDRTVRLWDVATSTQRQALQGHEGCCVTGVAFSPDGLTVASGSDDRTVWLWDVATSTQRQALQGHEDCVTAVTFSPDGLTMASGSDDRTVRLWDVATSTQRQALQGHEERVTAVAFSPDGLTVASASEDGTVRLWDAATSTQCQELQGHKGWVTAVTFSPDGLTVASTSEDGTVRLWNAATSTQSQALQGHTGWVTAVAFSSDGLTVASGSSDRTVRLWDAATGTHRQTLQGHEDCVNAVAFSPDGLMVASASNDRTVRLWDAATGTHRQTLQGHEDCVKTVAFSPDGLTVASASSDWTVRLWDAATGTQKEMYTVDTIITTLSFSPDGRSLITDCGLLIMTDQRSESSINREIGIFVYGGWITRNGQQLIWLPPAYRASCVAVRGSSVVLGHSSGLLTFLWFK